MKRFFPVSAALFAILWGAHLVIGTWALRGFFGDGSLAFLLNLSHSYVFNQPGHLIYLYDAGTPREAQFFLNSLGLQVALIFNIHDAQVLKYIFNFWQFALPGFLYLLLFAVLWRTKNIAWGIFPLLSWAVLSAPVDWNAVNSSRWAVPIFWMHVLLVILAGKKIRAAPALAVAAIGLLMLGGLYETVVLQAVLTLAIGGVIGWREGNRVPLIYAAAAIPGAIRAGLSYFAGGGDQLPNGFHQLTVIGAFPDPYILFIVTAVAGSLVSIVSTARAQRMFAVPVIAALIGCGVSVMISGLPDLWLQVGMRFDYLLLSFALMAVAGIMRVTGRAPQIETAIPTAHMILISGAFLWALQIAGTFAWQDCRAVYEQDKGDAALIVGRELLPLFRPRPQIQAIGMGQYSQCQWDWAEPWEDLLTAPDGQARRWEQFTFWQDFGFITRDGQAYLYSNNGTLVPPSAHQADILLPLKTLLYDLTPLYHRVGAGDLFPRAVCMNPAASSDYWRGYLEKLDDRKRGQLFVCPRPAAPVTFTPAP